MTTTENVMDILTRQGGYRELGKPFNIATLSFDFTHVLIGGDRANDLIVVIELTNSVSDDVVERKLLALARALDVLGSHRPVTVVLTGGSARPEVIQSISRVCRVLPIGTPLGLNAAAEIRDWLSVLLPLELPRPVEDLNDWEGELRRQLSTVSDKSFENLLLSAALIDVASVSHVLEEVIRDTVKNALQQDEATP